MQTSEIGAGVYYGDYDGNKVEANIKISNSTFQSLSMGIEGVTSDYLEGKAVFENCVFDNVKLSSTVVSKSTESEEKIPQVLTIKNSDLQFSTATLRNWIRP